MPSDYAIDDFDFPLPQELIAQQPAAKRSESRLLNAAKDEFQHLRFFDLPSLLREGDLLVLNDTQVVQARLRGHKESGGAAECLLERLLDERQGLFQIKVSKPLRPGGRIVVGTHSLTCVRREGQFYVLATQAPLLSVLAQVGEVPLPPYIERSVKGEPGAPGLSREDSERYQTVFAARPGAVAAPTAGLHFDRALLQTLSDQGVEQARVTLHVGAGTFQPVRGGLADHVMHKEWYDISARAAEQIQRARGEGRRVVAVGTTVVRTLESVAQSHHGEVMAHSADTQLFIQPGFNFSVVDAMITNFHLPRSTLMMLVSAFAGYDRIMSAYRAAIQERYRFFSYGDAMWLTREPGNVSSNQARSASDD